MHWKRRASIPAQLCVRHITVTLWSWLIAFAVLTLLCVGTPTPAFAQSVTIYYVDSSKSDDSGDGTSWATAKKTLQAALALANPTAPNTAQIWVRAGTYYPDEGGSAVNDDRAATFSLKNRVAIYGGFAGSETLLSERDPTTNETILSGDLKQNDTPDFGNRSDNAFHVVTSIGHNNTAILDGFTIQGGNANGSNPSEKYGGGHLHQWEQYCCLSEPDGTR